jgi:hypothetical protein
MTKAEILAALPHLTPKDLADIRSKLDELTGDSWQDRGELTDADKAVLDAGLDHYQKNPNADTPWDQAKARIKCKLRS